jgi:SPP1 family predicted phage head-tail adaptor
MQAGDLKHQITIQFNASDGTTDDDWQTLCTVYAKKSGLTGRMFYQAAATQAESDVIFTIRYRTGIKPKMQIIDDTDTENPYEITAEPVDPDDKRQWLEIHTKRVI